MIPAQRDIAERRFRAAENLERARQIVREAAPFGLATRQHLDAIAAAEREWDSLTVTANWAVITR